MNSFRTALAAVVAVIFSAALQAGTQGRLNGTVTGPDGAPLEGVVITLTTPNISTFKLTTKTDKRGQYALLVNDATIPYKIHYELAGFAPHEESKKLSTVESVVLDVKLEKPVAQASAAPSPRDQAAIAYNAGIELLKGGDKGGAETKFLEATTKNPDLPQPWEALTILSFEKKAWPKVLEYGEKAVELDPSRSSVYQMMSAAAQQTGDKAHAAEFQKKYEDANPETPEALYNKGVEAYNKKDWKSAEAQLNQAIEAKPDFALAHFWLGMAAFNLNQKAASKEHFQKYLELDPSGDQADTAKEMLAALK